MDYTRIYHNIIQNRLKKGPPSGYSERHHIIPRSMGGSDESYNLISLTAKEHFICHLLLSRMYQFGTPEWKKMNHAFMMMTCMVGGNQERFTSNLFSRYRERFAIIMKIAQHAENNSQYGTRWIYCICTGVRKKLKVGEQMPIGWDYVINKPRSKKNQPDIKRNDDAKEKTKAMLIEWYAIYDKYGFDEFCKMTGYDKSKQNLVMRFAKYVPDFKPQNGKVRGNRSSSK